MDIILMRSRYHEWEIELNDTLAAFKLYEVLPLEREVNVWGGELYFSVPVECELENGRKIMDVGEVAFWPDGNAFCIFFGPTPVSSGSRPEAYSPVTPMGVIKGDLEALASMSDRTQVTLLRKE